ncbi:hypothetical protein HanPI659440_Chr04g0146971 [Helianthus annuus]|nr:hypothetical protein HanPI659440_Chr04g0146971 [Helianthus annuus]
MWLSSLMLTGAISKSNNRVAINCVITKARYKSGLSVDPGQVRLYEIIVKDIYVKSTTLIVVMEDYLIRNVGLRC